MKEQPNWFPKVHRMPSEWVMPDHFPDLSYYDEIAIDLETRDPNIKSNGPGYSVVKKFLVDVLIRFIVLWIAQE